MATVDWEKHVDEASGSTYYYNTRTGESSWDVPSDVSTLQEPMASEERPSPKWREFVDDASGATYYHDEVHGVSQWDKPEADITLDNKSDKIDKNPTNLATLKSIEKPKNDEDNYDLIVLDPELPVEIQDEDVDCNDTEEAKQVQEEHRDEDQGEDGASVVSSDGSAEGTAREAEKEKEDGQGPAGPWVKYVDAASGKPYYLNASTGTTQWDQPEGVEESQPAARLSSDHPVSAEYRSHLNRMHTERLARVTQQVLDPSGHLSRLNSILSSIDSKASAAVSGMNEEPADAPQTAKAEWQQHVDAQTQRYYYHNVVTGVTQWTKPDAPIVSGLASWVPPKLPDPESTVAGHKTVSGVNYAARAKFNRLTGKYEQLGGDEYWQNAGIAADRAGRQMSHFFDMTELEKNREEARRRKEQLKRKNIDWKKISAEKKAKKQKQRNEWLFTD
uniref:WW domain-containing protein n=1 Tax=Peronospora matthiolae TaxID=2874970 RepID=A0AAV1T690_9STRA